MGKVLKGELFCTQTGLIVKLVIVNTTLLYVVEIINNLEYMYMHYLKICPYGD